MPDGEQRTIVFFGAATLYTEATLIQQTAQSRLGVESRHHDENAPSGDVENSREDDGAVGRRRCDLVSV